MIISEIQTFPLRIPFKPGHVAAACVWGTTTARPRCAALPGPAPGPRYQPGKPDDTGFRHAQVPISPIPRVSRAA